MNGGEKTFEIQKREESLFLRVTGNDYNPQIILQALEKHGFSMSADRLDRILREDPDEWKRIPASSEYEEEKIEVRISSDRLTADINVSPGSVSSREQLIERINEILQSAGVNVETCDGSLLDEALDNRGEWTSVAFGTPPRDGVDAHLEVLVDIERHAPAGLENEEGGVDHKDLGIIHNVWKDQEIAIKIPMQEGEDGTDVTGKPLRAKRARDVKLVAGQNTVLSEDDLILKAAEDGHLTREGNKFSVSPVFEVAGDIDYATGNLDFTGSILVHGSVKDDFSLRAGKTIDINGVVEGACLFAEGDIRLKSGVLGMGRGILESGESIFAEHIDQCTVRAGKDLFFRQALMHCDVEVGSAIRHTEGGKGLIAGGVLKAGTEVECMYLGSEMGTKTTVHVGISPDLLEKRKQLFSGKEELETKGQMIEKNLIYLTRLMKEKGLDEHQKAMALKFAELQKTVTEQLGRIDPLIIEIEKAINSNKQKGNVKVWNTCYPGVAVTIRKETFLVQEAVERVRFIYGEGKIRMISLE